MLMRSGTLDWIVRRTSPEEERTLMLGRRRERVDAVGLMGPSTLAIESVTDGGLVFGFLSIQFGESLGSYSVHHR